MKRHFNLIIGIIIGITAFCGIVFAKNIMIEVAKP